jgi:hypothetical protein
MKGMKSLRWSLLLIIILVGHVSAETWDLELTARLGRRMQVYADYRYAIADRDRASTLLRSLPRVGEVRGCRRFRRDYFRQKFNRSERADVATLRGMYRQDLLVARGRVYRARAAMIREERSLPMFMARDRDGNPHLVIAVGDVAQRLVGGFIVGQKYRISGHLDTYMGESAIILQHAVPLFSHKGHRLGVTRFAAPSGAGGPLFLHN